MERDWLNRPVGRRDWMTEDDERRAEVRKESLRVIRAARPNDRLLIGRKHTPVKVLANDRDLQRITISYEADPSSTLTGAYAMWAEQGFVKA